MVGRAAAGDTGDDGKTERRSGPTPSAREPGIDLLRAVAILWVVLFHYTARFDDAYLRYETPPVLRAEAGTLGVLLFFVVSAYCIAMTLGRAGGLASFLARRAGRILPAYLVAVPTTAAVVAAFGLPGREVGLDAMLANLLLLNMIHLAPHVDGVYWSLVVELRFYLLMGVIYALARGSLGATHAAWRVVCLAGLALDASSRAGGVAALGHVAEEILLFPFAPFFLAGIAFYRWDSLTLRERLADGVLVAAGAIAVAEGAWSLTAALAVPLLAFVVLRARGLRVPRPILWIGLVSYPLYLLHQNVGLVLIRETAILVPDPNLRIALAIGSSLLAAAVVTRAVEPALRPRIEDLAMAGARLLVRVAPARRPS